MIIRVQSSDGTKRIECNADETIFSVYDKIRSAFNLSPSQEIVLFKTRNRKGPIVNKKSLKDYEIKHGDIIFIDNIQKVNGNNSLCTSYDEDKVDTILWNQTGLIERFRDPKICKHGVKAKCVNCTSIEPYDETYMKQHNIKHMSFHSYLRKMTGGIDRGKFAVLDNISCKIREGCKEHPPWPNGICTKCQPSAITLKRQEYRHVDNVVFENASIVESFLDYWRLTGYQRIGFLYGYYEVSKDVPLGIKATVVAIYEPSQESGRDFVQLHLPEAREDVDLVAKGLGFKRLGWIFTDLLPLDSSKGTVKHIRSADSHFLSCQEVVMAGHFQNEHPNPCRLSLEGVFGSKFVTVVVTGDKNNSIHMEGYQVSNQCMALVRDGCLLPTRDSPELGWVKEASKEQYVPDVFYTEKDEFGNEIKKLARLLPIEYLLVDVPVSTPREQRYSHVCQGKKSFPVGNRQIRGHLQDFDALASYLGQFNNEERIEAMKDFHLLIYLSRMEMLPLRDILGDLLEGIREKDKEKVNKWLAGEKWATIDQAMKARGLSTQPSVTQASTSNESTDTGPHWSCTFCTFQNRNYSVNCEMCGLPKQ